MGFYSDVKKVENVPNNSGLEKFSSTLKELIMLESRKGNKKVEYIIPNEYGKEWEYKVFRQLRAGTDSFWTVVGYLSDVLGDEFNINVYDSDRDGLDIHSFKFEIYWK